MACKAIREAYNYGELRVDSFSAWSRRKEDEWLHEFKFGGDLQRHRPWKVLLCMRPGGRRKHPARSCHLDEIRSNTSSHHTKVNTKYFEDTVNHMRMRFPAIGVNATRQARR